MGFKQLKVNSSLDMYTYMYIKSCLCAGYNSSKQSIDVGHRLAKLEQHVKKTGTELKKTMIDDTFRNIYTLQYLTVYSHVVCNSLKLQ